MQKTFTIDSEKEMISLGEKIGRAAFPDKMCIRDRNTAPQRKAAGITKAGFDDFNSVRVIWGTAMPTKEIGPARAVTHADSKLESSISKMRNGLIPVSYTHLNQFRTHFP